MKTKAVALLYAWTTSCWSSSSPLMSSTGGGGVDAAAMPPFFLGTLSSVGSGRSCRGNNGTLRENNN